MSRLEISSEIEFFFDRWALREREETFEQVAGGRVFLCCKWREGRGGTRGGGVGAQALRACLHGRSPEAAKSRLNTLNAVVSEEDKRATINVQNGLVFFFLISFIIFSSLGAKTVVKSLNSKKKSWRKSSEKL